MKTRRYACPLGVFSVLGVSRRPLRPPVCVFWLHTQNCSPKRRNINARLDETAFSTVKSRPVCVFSPPTRTAAPPRPLGRPLAPVGHALPVPPVCQNRRNCAKSRACCVRRVRGASTCPNPCDALNGSYGVIPAGVPVPPASRSTICAQTKPKQHAPPRSAPRSGRIRFACAAGLPESPELRKISRVLRSRR